MKSSLNVRYGWAYVTDFKYRVQTVPDMRCELQYDGKASYRYHILRKWHPSSNCEIEMPVQNICRSVDKFS
jgi:hypothetical protein